MKKKIEQAREQLKCIEKNRKGREGERVEYKEGERSGVRQVEGGKYA